jgi:phosphonate transport system permease protein
MRSSSRRALVAALVLLSVVAAAAASGVRPGRLLDAEGAANAWELITGMARPDRSGETLARVARLSVESLAIGVLGTALAVVLGIAMALVATRVPDLPDPPRGSRTVRLAGEAVRFAVRFALGVLRSIPDVVWAFLFVRLFGLGPGPAVLAIAVSAGGVIGKLFAELAEAVDPGPVHALRRAGAGRLAALVHGVLPQVRRPWVAYALFRLECSIRSASILGLVGAGGLGTEIAISVRFLEFDRLATALLAVLVLVAAIEWASAALRRRRTRWSVAALGLGALAALAYLHIPWPALWRTGAASFSTMIAVARWHVPEAIARAWPLAVQTVTMAWCATIAAAAVAFLAAPLASRTLSVGSYLPDAPRGGRLGRGGAAILFAGARLLFLVCRAMPELTLALLFVVWVGPGPLAGALAIGVHTIGVLGRLYGDVYEEVEPGPVAAVEASGAGRLGVWLFGVVPQIGPRVLAFTLYRFEVNVRMTAIVGFAGAGGIGDAIHTAMSLFHTAELVVLLAVLLAVVTALDAIGDRARYHILVARFGARGSMEGRARPSRLARFRVAPASAQQGDENGRDMGQEDRARRDRERRAVVSMLGAGEE